MKLLIILLILTISINNCLSSGVSYTLVPYQEKDCQIEDSNLGITFPLPIGSGGYSITPVLRARAENGCGVITSQSSNSFKFEWYIENDCSNPPKSKPFLIEEFSTSTCKYSTFLNDFYKVSPTSQIQFQDNTMIVQVATKSQTSNCDVELDGYFNYLNNGSSFSQDTDWITWTETYFCDENLNPFLQGCDSFSMNCTTYPLKNNCVSDQAFIYTCFGSESSSSSSSSS